MKLALVSPATAFASNVLPVPGGPYSKTPLGASTPILSNNSGCLIGNSTISRIFWTSFLRPPNSSYVILGTVESIAFVKEPSLKTVFSVTITGLDGFVFVITNWTLLPICVFSEIESPVVNTWFR